MQICLRESSGRHPSCRKAAARPRGRSRIGRVGDDGAKERRPAAAPLLVSRVFLHSVFLPDSFTRRTTLSLYQSRSPPSHPSGCGCLLLPPSLVVVAASYSRRSKTGPKQPVPARNIPWWRLVGARAATPSIPRDGHREGRGGAPGLLITANGPRAGCLPAYYFLSHPP
jgi:hypothetical protein